MFFVPYKLDFLYRARSRLYDLIIAIRDVLSRRYHLMLRDIGENWHFSIFSFLQKGRKIQ